MEITVKVEAEGLEKAINVLAQALSNQSIGEVAATQEQPKQEAPPVAPVKQEEPKQEAPPEVAPVKQEAPAQAVPTSNPSFTMDQLAVAATQLMDAGKRDEIINLLSTFNVQALTGLPKDQYGAFATSLRGMGAKL